MNLNQSWLQIYNDPFINPEAAFPDLIGTLTDKISTHLVTGTPRVDYDLIDSEKNHRVTELEKYKAKNEELFQQIKREISPWSQISDANFLDRGAILLANCDKIFNFNPRHQPIVYAAIGDKNINGINQYMQWRYPTSFGYSVGLSPEFGGEEYDRKFVTYTGHATTYCDDGSGDIVYNVQWIKNWILGRARISGNVSREKLKTLGLGVDFMVGTADGIMAEVAEILLALMILWPGGALLIKTVNTKTKLMADIIYYLLNCFDEVTLFKPVTADLSNPEIFIYAKDYYGSQTASDLIDILTLINNKNIDKIGIKSILAELPAPYKAILKNINNTLAEGQLLINTPIVEIMAAMEHIQDGDLLNKKVKDIITNNIPFIDVSSSSSYWDLGI